MLKVKGIRAFDDEYLDAVERHLTVVNAVREVVHDRNRQGLRSRFKCIKVRLQMIQSHFAQPDPIFGFGALEVVLSGRKFKVPVKVKYDRRNSAIQKGSAERDGSGRLATT